MPKTPPLLLPSSAGSTLYFSDPSMIQPYTFESSMSQVSGLPSSSLLFSPKMSVAEATASPSSVYGCFTNEQLETILEEEEQFFSTSQPMTPSHHSQFSEPIQYHVPTEDVSYATNTSDYSLGHRTMLIIPENNRNWKDPITAAEPTNTDEEVKGIQSINDELMNIVDHIKGLIDLGANAIGNLELEHQKAVEEISSYEAKLKQRSEYLRKRWHHVRSHANQLEGLSPIIRKDYHQPNTQ